MSTRTRGISLVLALALVGCAPAESGEVPPGLVLRVVCGIQRWLERNDFRVREEGVDRCSGAARQIQADQERAQELLRRSIEPPSDAEGGGAPEAGNAGP